MKIAINALGTKVAGGRTLSFNILREINSGDFDHKFTLLCFSGYGYEDFKSNKIDIITLPKILSGTLLRVFVDFFVVKFIYSSNRPDIILNLGFMPQPGSIDQIILYAWPYGIYDDQYIWDLMPIKSKLIEKAKRWFFQRRIKYATHIIAQTTVAENRLRKFYNYTKKISIVPNVVNISHTYDDLPEHITEALNRVGKNKKKLLCLSRYYPHKNIEVLVDAAKIIKDQNLDIVIFTTINEADHPAVSSILHNITKYHLQDILVNLNTVPVNSVGSLYQHVDGSILPTVLESYSGIYIESMHYGIPVFTSDLDFARVVCEDAAFYFDPLKPKDIVTSIEAAYNDPENLQRCIDLGKNIAKNSLSAEQICRKIVTLCEQVVNHETTV